MIFEFVYRKDRRALYCTGHKKPRRFPAPTTGSYLLPIYNHGQWHLRQGDVLRQGSFQAAVVGTLAPPRKKKSGSR